MFTPLNIFGIDAPTMNVSKFSDYVAIALYRYFYRESTFHACVKITKNSPNAEGILYLSNFQLFLFNFWFSLRVIYRQSIIN